MENFYHQSILVDSGSIVHWSRERARVSQAKNWGSFVAKQNKRKYFLWRKCHSRIVSQKNEQFARRADPAVYPTLIPAMKSKEDGRQNQMCSPGKTFI